MKKLFLFLLVFVSFLSLAACDTSNGNDDDDDIVDPNPNPGPDDIDPEWYKKDGNYTYNDFIGGTTSMNWSPLSWETNDDSYVLGYLSMGFYDYMLNETGDGWVVIPEMAESLPTDVTSKYVGQYGIAAGEEAKAWSIKLNKNACWETGEAITADDYIYSMQQQLDPSQFWRRADSYYGGDFAIYNAKNYLYSTTPAVFQSVESFGYESTAAALADGKELYLDINYAFGITAPEIAGSEDGGKLVPFSSDEVIAALGLTTAEAFEAYKGYFEVGCSYASCVVVKVANENMDITFDEVGLFKVDDYEIVIVIEKPLAFPDFYLPYYLSSTWLINERLFEQCWETTPDGQRINTYMQSLANSISYGPYKLAYFEADKQITFDRNEKWYGYTDGKHVGQFITDKVSCKVITEHSTALMSFLKGEIDGVGLDSTDIKTYGSSEYLLFSPESYTTKFTINTDLNSLTKRESEGVNKRMLTVKEFREAISLMLDRSYFTSAFTAAAAPGYGLMNYMYQVIMEDGSEATYRNTEYAKQALLDVYGIEYGEGTDYADIDEAYAAITGYDMEKAQELMEEAYEYAVENDLYAEGETVKISFSVYSSDTTYQQMFEYVKQQLAEATSGTSLEGKVEVEMVVDPDYYNSLYAGSTDLIFSTWGGATYGSLTLLAQCYCDDHQGGGNQMELGFNTGSTQYNVTVEIPEEGKEFTAPIKQWADWLNSNAVIAGLGSCSEYSVDTQIKVCAAIEGAYLAEFCAIPLYYRQSASLHSQKVSYPTNQYVNLIGYGGIRTMTYNYTDEQWESYIEKGELKY